jgi:hypothetical protein
MDAAGFRCPDTNDLASLIAACEREFMRAYLDNDESRWLVARMTKFFVELELGDYAARSVHVLSGRAPPWRIIGR